MKNNTITGKVEYYDNLRGKAYEARKCLKYKDLKRPEPKYLRGTNHD